jgi:hypothetical protein
VGAGAGLERYEEKKKNLTPAKNRISASLYERVLVM